MTLLPFLSVVFKVWLAVSFPAAFLLGWLLRNFPPPEPHYPPPVPEPEDDTDWLGIWPVDDCDDDTVALRFEQLMAAEGLS